MLLFKKMVFKWRDSHVPQFLELFQKYECLWNVKSNSYKDRNRRDNAVRAIKEELNIDGVTDEDIKLKIKDIRTRCSHEINKIKKSTKSGCSTNEVYVPKLFWFAQADTFLNGACTTRDSSSNLGIESENNNSSLNPTISAKRRPLLDKNLNPNEQLNIVNDNNNTPRPALKGSSKNLEQLQNNDNSGPSKQINADNINGPPSHVAAGGHSTQSTSQAPRHIKRGKKIFSDLPIDRAIKQLKEINYENNKENEFDLFCRSLAVQLKAMPIQRALLCQERLQSVMVQERLRSMAIHSPANSEVIYSPRSTNSQQGVSEMSNYAESSYFIQSPPDYQPYQQIPYAPQVAHTHSQRSTSEMSNYTGYIVQSPSASDSQPSEMSNYTGHIVQSPSASDSQLNEQTSYAAIQLPSTFSEQLNESATSENVQLLHSFENYTSVVLDNNQSQTTVSTEDNSDDILQLAIRSIMN